jgi:hypothetical protein
MIGDGAGATSAMTIFAVPKAREGNAGTIQRNAVRSWTRLGASQVILCGDEAGTTELASEFGADHIPSVRRNDFGTPLLSSVFSEVEARARHDLLCYTNADLIFFPELLDAVGRITAMKDRFLIVGGTRNLAVDEELSEETEDWRRLRERALTSGEDRGVYALDFFIFRRGAIGRLPDFAVGRPYWDSWMVWNARRRRLAVVDISPTTLVVHQAHDYAHVKQATGPRWVGPELDRNLELYPPGHRRTFSLDDATHRLTDAGLVPHRPRASYRLGAALLLHPRTVPVYELLQRAYQALRRFKARTRQLT